MFLRLVLILVMLLPQVYAIPQGYVAVPFNNGAGASCIGSNPTGCLVRETFDGSTLCFSGFTSNCNNAFSNATAGFVFNYNTSPAPLQGTYSGSTAGTSGTADLPFTGQTTVYVAAMWTITAFVNNDQYVLQVFDSGTTNKLCYVEAYNTNQWLAFNTGDSSQSASAPSFSNGTTYYAKLKLTVGTGANAQCTGYWSNDGVTWNATTTSTAGTWTTNPAVVRLQRNAGTTVIWDDIRVSTSDIHW